MLDLARFLKSVIAKLTYFRCANFLESIPKRHFVGRFPSFKEVTFTKGVFQYLETACTIISAHLLFVSAKLNDISSFLNFISEVILLPLFSVGIEAEGFNVIVCLNSWV
jgi:hypothetical protein